MSNYIIEIKWGKARYENTNVNCELRNVPISFKRK